MGYPALAILLILALLAPLALFAWAWTQSEPIGVIPSAARKPLGRKKERPGKRKKSAPLKLLIEANPAHVCLACGVLLTLFGETTRRQVAAEQSVSAAIFVAIGLLFFGLGSVYATKPLAKPITSALRVVSNALKVSPAQVVMLATGLLLAMLAWLAAGRGQLMHAPAVAISAWGIAMVLGLLGAWQVKQGKLNFNWQTALIFAGFALAGFVLRVAGNQFIPNTLTGDEATGGLFAVEILQGKFDNVFGYGGYSFPALYFFIQSWSISFLGQTTEALRTSSALAGGLTVGAIYLAGKTLYGQRAGFVAAILLAGLHLHLHFSRIGLNNIWDGFWFTVVVGLLWYAWKKEQRWAFLLTGFALSLSQYFYVSVRMLFVLVVAWLILIALVDRKRFRRNAASIGLMSLVTLIVFLPLLVTYLSDFNQFVAPMQRVSLLGTWLTNEQQITGKPGLLILGQELWSSMQAFTNVNLRHWYTPEVPILRPAAAAFFLLGILLMLLQWRKPQHWLVALWLAAFVLSVGLSESTPASQRLTGVAPAAALVVGFTLSHISKQLTVLWKPAKRGLVLATLLVALLLSVSDLNFYFTNFTPRGDYSGDNTAIAQHLADYLRSRPAGTQVAFFGEPRMGYYSIASLSYLVPGARGVDMQLPLDAAENPALASAPTVFVFLPENEAGALALAQLYPGAEIQREYSLTGTLLYIYAYIPNFTGL